MVKRKITKPATPAQKAARERNWNKAQILCIKASANRIYSSKTTHENEKANLGIIIDSCCEVIANWNK